jgi:hypothetical protein
VLHAAVAVSVRSQQGDELGGHVACMEGVRKAYSILVGGAERRVSSFERSALG